MPNPTTHFSTRLDIAEPIRTNAIALLNKTLASTLDLKTQVKQAHWNVKGKDFYQLHLLFDEMSVELEEFIDIVAERVTSLGGYALGTTRAAAKNSELPEYEFDAIDSMDHVTALADRFAIYGKSTRHGIEKTQELGDADTADIYTQISRVIDKRLWFLEAHLQRKAINETSNSKSTSGVKVGAK